MVSGGVSREVGESGRARLGALAVAATLMWSIFLAGGANAGALVDVFEDDGLPTVLPSDPDLLLWNYTFRNNTDTEPPSDPYQVNAERAAVNRLYSTAQPFLASTAHGWDGGFTRTPGEEDLWNWTVFPSDPEYEIPPGGEVTFTIGTYRSAGSPIVTRTLPAHVYLPIYPPIYPITFPYLAWCTGPAPPHAPRPIVEVYEDDGEPQVIPTEDSDILVWQYIVENNSDRQPPAPQGPYNENSDFLIFDDLYSQGEPWFGGYCQTGWYGIATPGSGPGWWNIIFGTDTIDGEIGPGESGVFWILTTIPHGTEYEAGFVEAQGFLISAPTEPVEVVGAVGFWVPGDADGDGDVDFLDYLAWKAHAGADAGAGREDGDFDHDGDVDRDDFLILQGNFGWAPIGQGEFSPADHAPEPPALWLLALAGPAALRRRRT